MSSSPLARAPAPAPRPLAAPGRNCWRRVRTDRLAVLVDGESYFRAVHEACSAALRSIFVIGWDVDSRVPLRLDGGGGLPAELGPFFAALARQRRGLDIYILDWAFPRFMAAEREPDPESAFGRRKMPRRVHFHLDSTFGGGASCHQKIVVVDDAVAFVGGQDLTGHRWDTSDHLQDDGRRIDPGGKAYPPIHEVMAVVDGEAARSLGEIARDRWHCATGRRAKSLAPPSPAGPAPWPASVRAEATGVTVAIARTQPDPDGGEAVREIERLYLDMIAAARRTIFIENQFFTSTMLGQALAERLREPHGPEVVVVTSRTAMSWLEETTMGVLRARLVERLRRLDVHGRFRIYFPRAPGPEDVGVKVHSKVMIVDDELLRVGSSNFNNRSMVLDPECDVALEAAGDPGVADVIRAFRHRLVAEHLAVEPAVLAAEEQRLGRLGPAIDALARPAPAGGDAAAAEGADREPYPRTLEPLDPAVPGWLDAVVPGEELLDPFGPLEPERIAGELVPEDVLPEVRRSPLALVGVGAGILLLLAAAWRFTPLGRLLLPEYLAGMMLAEASLPVSLAAVAAVYVAAGALAVPVNLLIFSTGLAFGPFAGLGHALFGSLLSAGVYYAAGAGLGRRFVNRLAGVRLSAIAARLGRHGFLAVAAVRLVPVAPFTVVNLVAGATRVPPWPYALGTLLGLLPGTVAMSLFGGQVGALFRSPTPLRAAAVAALVLLIAAAAAVTRRVFRTRAPAG